MAVEHLEGRAMMSATAASAPRMHAAHVVEVTTADAPRATPRRWAWLADTYWYVPKPNLPAIIYDPGSGTLIPIRDQTVYHISGYRTGYFWGETVSQFGQSAPSSSALIGSVTPQGRVLLSFSSSSEVTQGYGSMTKKRGQWAMENQMFSGSASGRVGHWAYMVQTRPGMKSWKTLPLAKVSVPTFLGHYSGPVPKPVG
jgi:hypothetical protein